VGMLFIEAAFHLSGFSLNTQRGSFTSNLVTSGSFIERMSQFSSTIHYENYCIFDIKLVESSLKSRN